MKKNKVYLIGAGPAGEDLITVRGLRILQQADVVIYDYLVDKELLNETKPGAELICCDRLDKKLQEGNSAVRLVKIITLMVNRVNAGKKVVRLKNGDPFIFGRAAEEITALLKNRIEYEVVPGITAASVAACFSGIPLTDRRISSSVVFVTGHEASGKDQSAVDWKGIASVGTIVLYMAVGNISKIVHKLIKAGRSPHTPVAAVYQAGRVNQKIAIAQLKDIPEAIKRELIGAPAIFVIGEVVRFNKILNWFKRNKLILFTGLSARRYFLKGSYFHLPMIEIKPLENYTDFDRQLKAINTFDWIVFTSRYAAHYFFERLGKIGLDTRSLYNIKIAAIGASTANKLKELGITADLIPKVETSRGLLAAFKKISPKERKIFLPHSDISDKGLATGLRNFDAEVTACVAYRNVMPEDLPDLDLDIFDKVVFTSPSGVRNFVKRYGLPARKSVIGCIGEITQEQARKLHLL